MSSCQASLKKPDAGYLSGIEIEVAASPCPFERGKMGLHLIQIDNNRGALVHMVMVSVKSVNKGIKLSNDPIPTEFADTIPSIRLKHRLRVPMVENPGIQIQTDEIETVVSLYDHLHYRSGGTFSGPAQTTPILSYSLDFQ